MPRGVNTDPGAQGLRPVGLPRERTSGGAHLAAGASLESKRCSSGREWLGAFRCGYFSKLTA